MIANGVDAATAPRSAMLHEGGFVGRLVQGSTPRLEAWPTPRTYRSCQALNSGFIANRAALTAELSLGAAATRVDDSEIFVAAFERWGDGLQRRVIGEYCVAIFDTRAVSLLLTHDALGMRPVFYSDRRGSLAFASHLEALPALTGLRDLDEAWIGDYLAFGKHPGSSTVYASVSVLEPGRSLRWSRSGLSNKSTWSFNELKPRTNSHKSDNEERFRNLLCEAVTTAREGKTWAELSGGLDSSSVVCAALQAGTRDLEALSIVYSRSNTADEREWMQALLSERPIPWRVLDGDEAQPFSELPDRLLPQPSSTVLNWKLFRKYRELAQTNDVRVILTGTGGDNVLFAPPVKPVYLADWLLKFDLRKIYRELHLWQDGEAKRRSLRHLFMENAARPLMQYARGRSLMIEGNDKRICPWIAPDFQKRLNLKPANVAGASPRMRSVGDQYTYERFWMQSLDATSSWNLLAIDFQFRAPLLYRPLVEFMYALPWREKILPGQDRVLQRSALKGILPERIRTRRNKRSTDEAIFAGLLGNREAYALLTENPLIVSRGYVQGAAWKEAVSRARFGVVHAVPSLLAAASLELWLREFERFDASSLATPI